MILYLATGRGFARLEEREGGWEARFALEDSGAQCLAVDPADPATIYAGCRGGGVKRSDDGGESWSDCALPEPDVFSLAVSPADGAVYAGTEPSRLFRSGDGAGTWEELEALQAIPSRPSWS
ncbi:MAG TPA: hypothetical protein VGV36_00905, partial [Solirubrobacteraceae bacterium]|nr:hypothetical protein [Solirubrobacteraceae bacterium]